MAFKRFDCFASVTALMLLVGAVAADGGQKIMGISTEAGKHTNRLINESSPYLLQHAHNPVDWYPWGAEAFARAKKEGKAIFLSIGYSACHWCHVMERESFANEEIAKIMNEHFVSIKVDREQRPDVDTIYMQAVQSMTGGGGWPLSVFLTPDGKPFYGGTYFPAHDMYGKAGFGKILLTVAEAWSNRREELTESAGKISDFLAKSVAQFEGKEAISVKMLENGFEHFKARFDVVNGGFGFAPKFPMCSELSMLIGYWRRSGEKAALAMAEKTLESISRGGIYDHIGGGLHRYSTDTKWLVPHFEKMLYDEALAGKVYIQAYQATGKRGYAKTAMGIFEYVLRDMTDAKGGFYSAEDADSEGIEGAFYVWDTEAIDSVLVKAEAEVFKAYYGVSKKGNFEESKSILSVSATEEELAKRFDKKVSEIEQILSEAREKVFKAREKRMRPMRDDKIIAGWNGLMISSLAYGGAVLGEQRYIKAAERSAEFILDRLHKNGRLKRYWRGGVGAGQGFLDDYAFMTMGMVDLYEASFDVKWLTAAKRLTEEMVGLFYDEKEGGFFLTGKDGEELIARSKPMHDGSIPSGNSVGALALLKLGRITGDSSLTERGISVLEAFSGRLNSAPGYLTAMLSAVDYQLGPSQEIVIAGKGDSEQTKAMLKIVRSKFLPNAVVLVHDEGKVNSAFYKLVPYIKGQVALEGKTTAYVCENYVCKQPVQTVAELEKMIGSATSRKAD